MRLVDVDKLECNPRLKADRRNSQLLPKLAKNSTAREIVDPLNLAPCEAFKARWKKSRSRRSKSPIYCKTTRRKRSRDLKLSLLRAHTQLRSICFPWMPILRRV